MVSYGWVKIVDGPYKGRIGYYDDDDKKAIVYWGSDDFTSNAYSLIDYQLLDNTITTMDLVTRMQGILNEITTLKYGKYNAKKHAELLSEYILADSLLSEKYNKARTENGIGELIFLSHSSKDKPFVKVLATDLKDAGYKPWLDEWQIKVGESIPRKINFALQECKYFVIVLSKNSTESKWVEEEFYATYGSIFDNSGKFILPVLLEECEVPYVLKHYKYANFLSDYQLGLQELLNALNG